MNFLNGKITYIVGFLIIALGVYQFFSEACKSGIETVLLGAGFMGLRRAIANQDGSQ
jgi:hypothetical protein